MSRIGKKPILLPKGVKLNISAEKVEVEGPKGRLFTKIEDGIGVEIKEGKILVTKLRDSRSLSAFQGMRRAIIANMVKGTSEGWARSLLIEGVGYKAELKGNDLFLILGYSHPISFPLPEGVHCRLDKPTTITLESINKELLGKVASSIRALKVPDSYHGKGIRYSDEIIKKKPGKSGAK